MTPPEVFALLILLALCCVALAGIDVIHRWNDRRICLRKAARRAAVRRKILSEDYPGITADLEHQMARIAYLAVARAELDFLDDPGEPTPFALLSDDERDAWIASAKKHLCRE